MFDITKRLIVGCIHRNLVKKQPDIISPLAGLPMHIRPWNGKEKAYIHRVTHDGQVHIVVHGIPNPMLKVALCMEEYAYVKGLNVGFAEYMDSTQDMDALSGHIYDAMGYAGNVVATELVYLYVGWLAMLYPHTLQSVDRAMIAANGNRIAA